MSRTNRLRAGRQPEITMHKSGAGFGLLHYLTGGAALLALACTAEVAGPDSGSPAGGSGPGTGGQPTTPGPVTTDDNGLFTNPPPFQPAPGTLRRLTRSQ